LNLFPSLNTLIHNYIKNNNPTIPPTKARPNPPPSLSAPLVNSGPDGVGVMIPVP
jgi:hypothetical protein